MERLLGRTWLVGGLTKGLRGGLATDGDMRRLTGTSILSQRRARSRACATRRRHAWRRPRFHLVYHCHLVDRPYLHAVLAKRLRLLEADGGALRVARRASGHVIVASHHVHVLLLDLWRRQQRLTLVIFHRVEVLLRQSLYRQQPSRIVRLPAISCITLHPRPALRLVLVWVLAHYLNQILNLI